MNNNRCRGIDPMPDDNSTTDGDEVDSIPVDNTETYSAESNITDDAATTKNERRQHILLDICHILRHRTRNEETTKKRKRNTSEDVDRLMITILIKTRKRQESTSIQQESKKIKEKKLQESNAQAYSNKAQLQL